MIHGGESRGLNGRVHGISWRYSDKTCKKINYISISSETAEPRAFIFGMKHCLVDLHQVCWGWSGGAMVLGELPVPGLPTNLG